MTSPRKQPTFGDDVTGFPTKWHLRNEHRNSILMTRHYPDLGSTSDWSCRVGNLFQPIRSTTQIWVVTRHQYGISALVSQTSFGGETSWKVAKCRLFSQAMEWPGVEQCSCVHCRLLLSKKYLSVPFSYIHTYILYCFLPAKGAFQQQSLFTSVKYINKLQHST